MPWGSPNRAAALQQASLLSAFPSTLPNLEGWWRCDSVVTDGFTISQINDQSGLGRPAVQANGLLQPDYDTANFERASAAFAGGPYLTIGTGLATAMPADNWTMWCALQCADDSFNQGVFSIGSSGGVSIDVESSAWVARVKGVGTPTDGASDTFPHLIEVTRASGTLHMYIDSAEVSLTSPTASVIAPSGSSSIGSVALAVFTWVGWFLESGAVSRVLTSSERAQLYSYYRSYYSL